MSSHVKDNQRTQVLILNSLDRDWVNNEGSTPYNFEVSFTETNSSNIAIIEESYKNISSIEIPSFIISNSIDDTTYHSNSHVRPTNNPYLLVELDEIIESSRGTNKYLDSSMGIYTPSDLVIENSNNIKNIRYVNTGDIKKNYFQTPISTLSELKVKIRNPSGTLLNSNDVVGVSGIYNGQDPLQSDGTDYLKVRCSTFFTDDEFESGDTVIFKNYNYSNMSYSESYNFQEFINRSQGHKIIDIGRSTSATLFNEIHIQTPSSYSRNTGVLSPDSWFTSFMDKSLTDTYIASNGGKIINASKQSHIIVKLGLKEKILI